MVAICKEAGTGVQINSCKILKKIQQLFGSPKLISRNFLLSYRVVLKQGAQFAPNISDSFEYKLRIPSRSLCLMSSTALLEPGKTFVTVKLLKFHLGFPRILDKQVLVIIISYPSLNGKFIADFELSTEILRIIRVVH